MKRAHLTLEDRKFIQHGLEEGISKSKIAKDLGKSPSTISKEVNLHRRFIPRRSFSKGDGYYCANKGLFDRCSGHRFCQTKCNHFVERTCKRLKKIGVCNKCPNSGQCFLDKYKYNAVSANEIYLYTLRDSREGVNLTTSKMINMAEIVGPLLKKGQSIYQIVNNHPELKISVKSMYNYIEAGIFRDYGIDNFSLRRQVSMKKRKKLKERKQPVCYDGHKYEDYLKFKEENPGVPTTEMDTVFNNPEGPYVQTFIFENAPLMIGFLHEKRTSESMAASLNILQEKLGSDYKKIFSLLLTDRGPEFTKSSLFETNYDTGEVRSNIFYCDPQMPSQKPHVENNHNYVRDILPNGKKLSSLTQKDIDLMFSHINSVPRESLNGKTPYDVFLYFYGKEILDKLNVNKIDKDTVTLMPYLLNIK